MKSATSVLGPRTGLRRSVLGSITGRRLGRTRTARMFPAEAERLATPAELQRLWS